MVGTLVGIWPSVVQRLIIYRADGLGQLNSRDSDGLGPFVHSRLCAPNVNDVLRGPRFVLCRIAQSSQWETHTIGLIGGRNYKKGPPWRVSFPSGLLKRRLRANHKNCLRQGPSSWLLGNLQNWNIGKGACPNWNWWCEGPYSMSRGQIESFVLPLGARKQTVQNCDFWP